MRVWVLAALVHVTASIDCSRKFYPQKENLYSMYARMFWPLYFENSTIQREEEVRRYEVLLAERDDATKFYQLYGSFYVHMDQTFDWKIRKSSEKKVKMSGFVAVRYGGRLYWHCKGNDDTRLVQLVCQKYGYRQGYLEQGMLIEAMNDTNTEGWPYSLHCTVGDTTLSACRLKYVLESAYPCRGVLGIVCYKHNVSLISLSNDVTDYYGPRNGHYGLVSVVYGPGPRILSSWTGTETDEVARRFCMELVGAKAEARFIKSRGLIRHNAVSSSGWHVDITCSKNETFHTCLLRGKRTKTNDEDLDVLSCWGTSQTQKKQNEDIRLYNSSTNELLRIRSDEGIPHLRLWGVSARIRIRDARGFCQCYGYRSGYVLTNVSVTAGLRWDGCGWEGCRAKMECGWRLVEDHYRGPFVRCVRGTEVEEPRFTDPRLSHIDEGKAYGLPSVSISGSSTRFHLFHVDRPRYDTPTMFARLFCRLMGYSGGKILVSPEIARPELVFLSYFLDCGEKALSLDECEVKDHTDMSRPMWMTCHRDAACVSLDICGARTARHDTAAPCGFVSTGAEARSTSTVSTYITTRADRYVLLTFRVFTMPYHSETECGLRLAEVRLTRKGTLGPYCHARPALEFISRWNQLHVWLYYGLPLLTLPSHFLFTYRTKRFDLRRNRTVNKPTTTIVVRTANRTISWQEAKKECEKYGEMVTIRSTADAEEVMAEMLRVVTREHKNHSQPITMAEKSFYIGLQLTDGTERQHTWTDGQPLTTVFWAGDQPNGTSHERCTMIVLDSIWTLHNWHDVSCYIPKTNNSICTQMRGV